MQKLQTAPDLLFEYVATQQRLCETLFDRYPVDDAIMLTDLPKRGILSLDDNIWEFERHGCGVCFVCVLTNEVVDAHIEPIAHSRGIDAWRILQYVTSKDIHNTKHGTKVFDVTSERGVETLLVVLCNDGLLTVSDSNRRIYTLDQSIAN